MALSINWATKVITVPKADLLLLQSAPPIEIRQLNINDFRLELGEIQASQLGIWADTIYEHFPPVTVAGVDLARVVRMINGYTVTFEDGTYAVNIVGGNSDIADNVNINNVAVRTANSAGLMDIEFMQAAAFNGQVAFAQSSQYSGTTFPVGTRGYPVNNSNDLKSIMENRGLNEVAILESMTIDSGTDFSGLAAVFTADNPSAITVTLDTNADVENSQFVNMTIQGTLDGSNIIRNCIVKNINYVNGYIHQCALEGTVTLGGGNLLITDCWSGIPGGGPGQYPWIDMGGSGNSLALRGYDGGIGLKNGTGAGDASSLDLDSGRVYLDSTLTAGSYWIRGVAEVEDNSNGATVYDYTISEDITYMRKLLDANETLADGDTDNWQIIDPDDGVTVLRTRSVTDKDGNPISLPTGAPARRTNS